MTFFSGERLVSTHRVASQQIASKTAQFFCRALGALSFPRACVVLAVLCCVCMVLAVNAPANLSPMAQYNQAKESMQKLEKKDGPVLREPWLNLAQRLYKLHNKEQQWNQRAAALFLSAKCLDTVARASFRSADSENAVSRYLELASKHPKHVLADDALFQAALLMLEQQKKREEAEKLFQRIVKDYPQADHAPEAKKQLALLQGEQKTSVSIKSLVGTKDIEPSSPKTDISPKGQGAKIEKASWSQNGALVRLELLFSKPVQWELRSLSPSSKQTPRLIIELFETSVGADVSSGGKVKVGALQRVLFDQGRRGHSKVLLDFSQLQAYSAHVEQSGHKLVVLAAARRKDLPGGLSPGMSVRSPNMTAVAAESGGQHLVATRHLASQLGLGVKRIVVDAGHGGKDPGTNHNGILERVFTLKLSKKIGSLLKAKGYEVVYTRTDDTGLSLSQRASIANDGGDLLLSLHVNAAPNPAISGFETYYLDVPSSSEAVSLAGFENALSNRRTGDMEQLLSKLMLHARRGESRDLAREVQKVTLQHLKKKGFTIKDGGVKSAPFLVLMESKMPGILIEAGYCTNKADAKKLASEPFVQAMAEGIAEGVLSYVESLKNIARR